MNEIFGYCGWDFGDARNNEFQKGEHVRIRRDYAEASINVLEAHPDLWEMVDSLE